MNLEKVIAVRTDKTVYRDGDKAIKVFDEGYSKANILNEALNQARIEETALNIPKILAVTMVEGKWAIVSEYIEGKTLDRLMKEDPAHFDQYLERFVRLQMLVHAQQAPQLTQLKDKMQAKISQTEFDATTRYDLHTRLEGMRTHNKVCHGDFNPSNIIITPDDEAYILDWSHVTRGNAAADAARTYLCSGLRVILQVRRSTWICTASSAIRPSSMCKSGCRLSQLHKLSRAIPRSASSSTRGSMSLTISKSANQEAS